MSDTAAVDVDMTPMIDIVFQLITFFMVVINFDAADTDERVKMAQSDLARPPKVKPESELVLQVGYERTLGPDGTLVEKRGPFLFYGGTNIPMDRLEADFELKLRREFQLDVLKKNVEEEGTRKISKTTVVIRADAECPTGSVQKLIQLCQKVGYEKFAIKAQQPEPP